MIKHIIKSTIFLLVLVLFCSASLFAQNKVTGLVKESTSNMPIESVLVSIAGESARTDANGKFEVTVTDPNAFMVVQIPGYTTRVIELNGRSDIVISLISNKYKSIDDQISTPLGTVAVRDLTQAGSFILPNDISQKANSNLDQVMQGKLSGTNVIVGSGMPSSRSFINMRGLTSMYGSNNPLLIVDEMIHPLNHGIYSAIDGFSLNPFDLVDVDDVSSISVFHDGNSHLGSSGANGVIYLNTEQRGETSGRIVMNAYSGVAFSPKRQDLLDAQGFRSLFNDQLAQSGLSQETIDKKYSFLNAPEKTEEYYRYNNNTNWQDEIYRLGTLQKYHLFLKGGDNIATYNISTGYLMHEGVFKNTNYSRINIRVNGKINISDRFSIYPNTKLSLADSKLMEQGYNVVTNPILAAQYKSPLMAPNRRDQDGLEINFLDDIGAFNVSNPTKIVRDVDAINRNYSFVTSVKGQYVFTKYLKASTFIGINFNNSRDNIFIPDIGMARIDSAYNTIRVMVNEYRSLQNQNQVNYSRIFDSNNTLDVKVGHRFVDNTYEFDKATDMNSNTDDFKTLGQGSKNRELRTITGEKRGVKWVSYYATADYSYASKYYLSTALSFDGNSALHKNSRYNFYPSLTGAWRISSEPFMSDNNSIDDLKIRASFSQTGNINNPAYDYSHLYYSGVKLGSLSVLRRVAVPNPDMEIEKQTTINLGVDVAMLSQKLNLSLNVFNSTVGNLITLQQIAPAYGYTDYYSNSGVLTNMGADLTFDYHQKIGKLTWNIGGSATYVKNNVSSLEFKLTGVDKLINKAEGVELVTQAGSPLYSYYGYKTNGIFNDGAEASQFIGPNGKAGKAGDVRYVDVIKDGVINDLDKQAIGSPIAPIYGGLYTSFEFGDFEIRTDFSFSVGNSVYNHVNKLGQSMQLGLNQQKVVENRWTSSNTNTSIPAVSIGDAYGNNVFSDRWVEDGSYARMKNLTISYTYPKTSKIFESLTVYATATNLITFTSYSGFDPEFMLYNNPLYMGNDYGQMPQPKSVVIGIKLGL